MGLALPHRTIIYNILRNEPSMNWPPRFSLKFGKFSPGFGAFGRFAPVRKRRVKLIIILGPSLPNSRE